jgi:2-C-methyl-D-erythritol 4-phosphate cytidylyltransferase
VHDAARPLVGPTDIEAVVAQAKLSGAATLAARIVETLKIADQNNRVAGSVDRTGLWSMQTPQVFRRDWLIPAYKRLLAGGGSVTDEVSAVQAMGHPVHLVQSETANLKITYPSDLDLVRKLINLEITHNG